MLFSRHARQSVIDIYCSSVIHLYFQIDSNIRRLNITRATFSLSFITCESGLCFVHNITTNKGKWYRLICLSFCIYAYLQWHLLHLGFPYPWNLEFPVPSQYSSSQAKGRIDAKSCEVSKPWDRDSGCFVHSDIWQALWQWFCRYPCQMSERYVYHNTQSRDFETSRSRDIAPVRLVNKGQEVQWRTQYQITSVPIHPVLTNNILTYFNGLHYRSPEARFNKRHSLNK